MVRIMPGEFSDRFFIGQVVLELLVNSRVTFITKKGKYGY